MSSWRSSHSRHMPLPKTKPLLDQKKTVLRHRVREPSHFKKGSYLTYVEHFKDGEPVGVHLISAVLKSTGKREVQAVTFDMSRFTKVQAKSWLQKHPEYDYQG